MQKFVGGSIKIWSFNEALFLTSDQVFDQMGMANMLKTVNVYSLIGFTLR